MNAKDERTGRGLLAGLPEYEDISNQKQAELNSQLVLLRTWQSERIKRTHADLLARRRYGPACHFFLSDIYPAKDYNPYQQDLEDLYNLMRRFIPDILLVLARNVVDLNHMTGELDQALLGVLVEDLGMVDHIDAQMYAQGYRILDNYAERKRQIELLIEIGRQVEFSTRFPPIGMTLRLARVPARRAGWHELQDFLERGYKAFKHMGKAKTFLETIQSREMRILDRIFENHPDPLSLSKGS